MRHNHLAMILLSSMGFAGCGASATGQPIGGGTAGQTYVPQPTDSQGGTRSTTTGATSRAPSGTTGVAPATTGGSIVATTTGGGGTGTSSTTGGFGTVQVNEAPGSLFELLPGQGTGGGKATVNGTVGGAGLTPVTAIFDIAGDAKGNPLQIMMLLSDKADACKDIVSDNSAIENETFAWMYWGGFAANGNNLSLIQNETFNAEDPNNGAATGNFLYFEFIPLDNTCKTPAVSFGESGTISATSFSMTSVNGTFDVKAGANNSHLTGTFAASPCPGMFAAFTGNTVVNCEP